MTARGRPADVLVIDSHSDLRHDLASLLERAGHSVATASGVGHAEECLRHRRPCLILLALQATAPEGWQFLSARHHDPTLANIPVVVLSAEGRAVRSRAFALGANDFLDKPVDAADLLAVVGRYCRRAGGPNPSPRVRPA